MNPSFEVLISTLRDGSRLHVQAEGNVKNMVGSVTIVKMIRKQDA